VQPTSTQPTAMGIDVADVLAVLDALAHAGCRAWVGGGWGVDALVGRPTRSHRDLDLAIEYPRHCFTTGSIGGVVVACLSVEQQLRFHAGYEPEDIDRHDLALLHQLKARWTMS
jgi:lincosamide nucleotidyltransferase A/C/D/E